MNGRDTRASGGFEVVRIGVEGDGYLTPEILEGLTAHLAGLALRPPAWLVLAGSGGRFGLGLDLRRLRAPDGRGEGYLYPLQRAAVPLLERLRTFPAPTLALLEGPALGASLTLALACDLRWAVSDSGCVTGYPELGLGLLPVLGGGVWLARVVGPYRAADLLVRGRLLAAGDARTLGLVDRVVEPGTAAEGVAALLPSPAAARRWRRAPRRHPQGSTWIDRLIEGSGPGRRRLRRALDRRLAVRVPGEELRRDLLETVLPLPRPRWPEDARQALERAEAVARRPEADDLLSLYTLRERARRSPPEEAVADTVTARLTGAWWREALLLLGEGARTDALDAEAARRGLGAGPFHQLQQVKSDEVRTAIVETDRGAPDPETVTALEILDDLSAHDLRPYRMVRGRSRPDPAVYRRVEQRDRRAVPERVWDDPAYREAGERLLAAVLSEGTRLAAEGHPPWVVDLVAVESLGWTGVGGGPLRRSDRGEGWGIGSPAGEAPRFARSSPPVDGCYHPGWPLPVV